MDLIGSDKRRNDPDIRYIHFISNRRAAGVDSVDLNTHNDIFLNSIVRNAFKHNFLNSLYAILSENNDCRQVIKRIKTVLKEQNDPYLQFHAAVLIGNKDLTIKYSEKQIHSTHEYTFEINGECPPRSLCALQVAAIMGYDHLIDPLTLSNSLPNETIDDPNGRSNTKPVDIIPLVLAARFGHQTFIEKLLNNEHACPNRKAMSDNLNNGGFTVLHYAAIYNNVEVIKTIKNFLDEKHETTSETTSDYNPSTGGYVEFPIAFAAALGNFESVNLLINNASEAARLKSVHAAAAMGKTNAIEILLRKDYRLANKPDKVGNSPLIVAFAAEKIEVAKLLVATSNVDCIDGASGYDEHISPINNTNNETSAHFQSGKHEFESSKREFVELLLTKLSTLSEHDRRHDGWKLLREAVDHDDAEEVGEILNKLPELYFDLDGNSIIHLAAKRNKVKVLKKFITSDKKLTTWRNNNKELPLHSAIMYDHADAVKCLLDSTSTVKEMLETSNSDSHTALHLAVYHHNRSCVDIIKMLVDEIERNSVSFDQVDKDNLTALHYAMRYCNQKDFKACRCIEQLASLSPVITKKNGSVFTSALHMAADLLDLRVLELVLRTFYVKDINNINELDKENRTALMICVEKGDIKGVELLLTYDAKVGKVIPQNDDELSVLHRLVIQSVEKPKEIKSVMKMFQVIKKAVTSKTEQTYKPDDITHFLTEQTVKYGKYSVDGTRLNVLQLAAATGASGMLNEFLKSTNLKSIDEETRRHHWKLHHIIPAEFYSDHFSKGKAKKSCIEFVVEHCEKEKFRKMQDVEPLQTVIKKLTSGRMFVSTFLLILHVIFMACFSVYTIQTGYDFLPEQSNQDIAVPYVYCLFLIYPLIQLINIIFEVTTHLKRSDLQPQEWFKIDDQNCTYMAKFVVFQLLSYAFSIVFCILIIVWYAQCIYIARDRNSIQRTTYAKTVSVALVFGWLYTIELMRGIPIFQGFGKYLKLIIFKDVLRIAGVYGVVLTGFALAIHVCILVESKREPSDESVTDTFFETFGQMLGQVDVFGAGIENRVYNRLSAGLLSGFVRGLMAIYLLMSTIILINLLIAMMSQSYSSVYDESQFLLNYESCKMFVDLTCKTGRTGRVWRWILRKYIFSSSDEILIAPPKIE